MTSIPNLASTETLKYLPGYAPETLAQVAQLIERQRLGEWLQNKYPNAHAVRTDKALFDYIQTLRQSHLRGAEPLAKVAFDSKLHVVQNALGTHTTISRCKAANSSPSAKSAL